MSDEELVIKTSVEQMFAPLQRLLDQLLGPAASEVGLALGDSVRMWRVKRRFRFARELQRFIEESGKDVKPIATRLFFPVLEAASIEDDDEMQTRWAALIANEATNVGSVHPSYIDILKQLAPDDARLLDKLCDWSERHNTRKITTDSSILLQGESDQELQTILKAHGNALENLVRLGLIQSGYGMESFSLKLTGQVGGLENLFPDRGEDSFLDSWYLLTDFAVRFVRACRAPGRPAHG